NLLPITAVYEAQRPPTAAVLLRCHHRRPRGHRALHPTERLLLTCSGHVAEMPTLKPCPVDLVAGFLGREPAVRAFGGCAVIDDGVDFASDRHGKAITRGELHDDAGGLDALSDLIHRCDDLVDLLTRAELLADMPVATALAGARDDEIAHPGQPGEGIAVPA